MKKNIGQINHQWADLFNDWVNQFGLIELRNSGRKYTWGNNQDNMFMATLDRVFMSVDWDAIYPATQLKAMPRVGSDHTPLVVDTNAIPVPKQKMFRFEKWCLEVEGFRDVVIKAWNTRCDAARAIDVWQFKIRVARKATKG